MDMSAFTTWTLPSSIGIPLFGVALLATAIAEVFIVQAVFRSLPSEPASNQVPAPRRWAEVLWVIVPLFGLAAAFWGGWNALS